MKRLLHMALAVVLLCGLYGHYTAGYAQDENTGTEQTQPSEPSDENSNSNSNSGGQPVENTEGSNDQSVSEAPPPDEQPPAENKTYSCPKCGYSSDGPGDCPACNVSLTEGSSGGDTTSETGGDSSSPTGDESTGSSSDSTSSDTSSSDTGSSYSSSDSGSSDSGSSDSGSSE